MPVGQKPGSGQYMGAGAHGGHAPTQSGESMNLPQVPLVRRRALAADAAHDDQRVQASRYRLQPLSGPHHESR